MDDVLPMQQFRAGALVSWLCLVLIFSSQVVAGQVPANGPAGLPLLVDVNWLSGHLDDPDIAIIDARKPAGYEKGHIPGAISLPSDLTYHSTSSRRLISQTGIRTLLSERGISNNSKIIVYCNEKYLNAARVLWVLEAYGHTQVALLNGGYPAWQAAGLPVDTVTRKRTSTSYRTSIRPSILVTRQQVRLAIDNPDIAIVDTRPPDEYLGHISRASRSGHIPTALNYPSSVNIEARDGGVFYKPVETLAKIYKDLDGYPRIFVYCGGGCGSSLTYTALRALNKPVSIYDGGWEGWCNDPDLPIESPAL